MAANTIVPAALQPGIQLTATAAAIITCAANTQVIVKRAVFTNVTAGAITITVYRVPSAGTPGATNTLIGDYSISANTSYVSPELANMVLNPGDTVQALASAATSINAFASGLITT